MYPTLYYKKLQKLGGTQIIPLADVEGEGEGDDIGGELCPCDGSCCREA